MSTTLVGWLTVVALAAAEMPADIAVVHGKVVTIDKSFSIAQAVAIRDGKIVAVGSDDDIRKHIGEGTRVIDARGRVVVPGLLETHVHATGAARGEVDQPFVQLGSIGEIQDWVRERVTQVSPGEWVRLPRVDVTRIRERRLPTRQDLDEAAPQHPAVFVWQYANKQVQVLNAAALKAAEITKDTKPPSGGKIHIGDNGEPTGVMENSGALTSRFLPRKSVPDDVYHASLERLLRRYNELGITSIFERNSSVDGFRTYEKLKAQGRLPVRVTVTIGLSTDGTVEGTEKSIKALPFKTGDGDEWVRVGPLKVGVDGGVLYGTAFMRDPYGPDSFSLYGISDAAYRGDLRISPEKLKNIIRTGHRLGWQMSAHVTGDAGVDAVLDAVEAANADSPIAPKRYTLIHAYFPNPETAKRAAGLGVCVDTQPDWYYKDGDALAEALGQARLKPFIGLKTWRDAGVKTAINADHMQGFDPVTSLNPYHPFLAVYTAVTRKTESGLVIGPEQRVSREDALKMLTIDAAWLGFDETRKGSLEVGKLGDLAILTDDPLTCAEEKIKDIRAAITVVNGKVVHSEQAKVVERYGYKHTLEFSRGDVKAVLCPDAGGRVLEFSWNGQNALQLDDQEKNRQPGKSPPMSAGRFDIGPELTTAAHPKLWSGEWKAEITGETSARLTSQRDDATGLQLIRDFELRGDASSPCLVCKQAMVNISNEVRENCHWGRSFSPGGGICLVPLAGKSKFPAKYAMYEDSAIINVRNTDDRIRERDGFLEILAPPRKPKLGFDSHAGWLAYVMPSDLMLVKRFATFPDRVYNEAAGLTLSVWYPSGPRIELEPIGPRERLAPGESASFTEEWWLLKHPFPKLGEAIDLGALKERVGKLGS